jgi:hypothetical protein
VVASEIYKLILWPHSLKYEYVTFSCETNPVKQTGINLEFKANLAENVITSVYRKGNMLTGRSSTAKRTRYLSVCLLFSSDGSEGLQLCSRNPHRRIRMVNEFIEVLKRNFLKTGKDFQQKIYLLVMKVTNGRRTNYWWTHLSTA